VLARVLRRCVALLAANSSGISHPARADFLPVEAESPWGLFGTVTDQFSV